MKIRKMIKIILLSVLALLLAAVCFLFVGRPRQAEDIAWGVNFSKRHAELLGLDWKANYLALFDDLGIRNIKIITRWDVIEPEEDNYYFDDLDWQIRTAEEKGAKILLVMGIKTGRWPECHIPGWAENMALENQGEEAAALVEEIVSRYEGSEAIWGWQVENEPFFVFGDCPKINKDLVKSEADLVRSLDHLKRPVVVSDSGEWSFWTRAARIGDVVGITMYKKVWFSQLGTYFYYPFPTTYYHRRAGIVNALFGKEVMVGELQAEPWGPVLLYDLPLEEQAKTMDLEKFKGIVSFAKKTGFDRFYLWGAEWWYWLKEKQGQPEIWQEARKLFMNSQSQQ